MSQNLNQTSKELKIASFLALFNTGLIVSSLGPLLVPIADFFHLKIAQVALPVVFSSMGFLVANVLFSFTWHIYKARLFLIFSSLLLMASLLGIILPHHLVEIILILFFFIGLGRGVFSSSINSIFSEISGSDRAKYLSFSFLFFGLGAFTGPLLVGVILTYKLQWQAMYLLLLIIILPPSMIFWRKKLYQGSLFFKKQKKRDVYPKKEVAGSPVFWSLIFARFLLIGGQISFFSFIPIFLAKVRLFSPPLASYSVSVFWLSVISGRAIYARYLHRADLPLVLISGAAGTALFISLSFLTTSGSLIILSIACSGLCLSFISPGMLALGGNVFPEYIGFTTGVFFAFSGAAGILFPWIIGIFSEKVGLAYGVFLIPILIGAGASILAHFRYSLTENSS